jgi:capsular polysaccharide export protein
VPTITLGAAVYDIPGLTHQGGIDSFWRHPEPIDKALLADFISALAGAIQVKGNFYHPEGRRLAAKTIAARVVGKLVNEPDAYVDVPPRLAWKRLPVPQERRHPITGLLPNGIDLPGKEMLVGSSEPALSTIHAGEVSDRLGGKFR